MKKIVTFLLALSMLAATVACGGGSGSSETTVPSESGTTAAAETSEAPDLPDVRFDGETFTILNGNNTTWMTVAKVTTEEENGDPINDAIYKRNLAVEDKYGIKIVEYVSDSARADLTSSIAADDDSYDIALMVRADSIAVTLEGLLLDYAKIPYIDTAKPWWVAGTAERMSIGGHTFFAISQFDTTHYDGVRTLFFNKQMIEEFKLENPYQLVYDMKWTLDKFGEMGMAVAQDLNGDSTWGEGDRFGYTSYENISVQTLSSGIGAIISVNKDSKDNLSFDLGTEAKLERYEALTKLLNGDNGFSNPLGVGDNNGGVAVFTEGRALFYNETLSNVKFLRQMKQDFGIIPAPMYNEEQGRYYSLGGNPYFMSVPATTPNLERTAVIVEALAYESLGRIDDAFYGNYLQGKLTRDEDSSKMLDKIFESLDYQLPVAASVFASTVQTMVWSGDSDFASYFASVKAAVEGEFKTVEEFIAANK